MSGIELLEIPPQKVDEGHAEAMRRIGWAILSHDQRRYKMVRLHLQEALEVVKKLEEGPR